ncbi:MAG TPA: hypothetical protein VNJ04_11985 [Gemmatimonadaceae bacterium]|nr:hypothetical protein [Gemmatimonadaceae bacterium]
MKQRPCLDCQKPAYGDYCRFHSNLRISAARHNAKMVMNLWGWPAWRKRKAASPKQVVQTDGHESWWTQGGTREEFFKRQADAYAERMRHASGRTTKVNLVE